MNLSSPSVVQKILSEHGFHFSKALGQNFLTDASVCPRMAEHALVRDGMCALEIGPGIGVLTKELALRAQKVVAVELDRRLFPVLEQTLGEFSNVKVVEGDAMKLPLAELIREEFGGQKVALCANLPYYITSPLIMRLLEEKLPVESITVMVQKEAAERLCAKVGSRDSGAVTVAVDYYAEPKILFGVGRGCFTPAPKVDSCVIQLTPRKQPKYPVEDEAFFFALVRGAFSQRRKTILNSASVGTGLSREVLQKAIADAGLLPTARIETLNAEDLVRFANAAYRYRKEGAK
ncbi:MAG: 16S rRNA (adenine(1518)-N(6)/adenine(1519)-N(6))-dimethyltransferase RsmA [Clostridia bacterium]|nr:16S rRNA (adenine(1518)-N(6)/adenine(1519)-N(6))-dimethyltransferase RsmA [Clostridia bacterium]